MKKIHEVVQDIAKKSAERKDGEEMMGSFIGSGMNLNDIAETLSIVYDISAELVNAKLNEAEGAEYKNIKDRRREAFRNDPKEIAFQKELAARNNSNI